MTKRWMVFFSLPFLSYGRRTLSFMAARPYSYRTESLLLSTQGRLTVRIIPSAQIDYDQKKPSRHVYDDIEPLVKQLEPWANRYDVSPGSNYLWDEKQEASILFDAAVTANGETIHIHSLRGSDESADKGLKRLTTHLAEKFPPKPLMLARSKGKKKPAKVAKSQTPTKVPTIRVGDVEIDVKKGSNLDLWRSLVCTDAIISFPIAPGRTIDLQIDSCPPTVLSIHSFEQLEQRVFQGIPLVISTQVLYATRACVSWFSNGKLVQKDSQSYTPTNVGEKIQIVVVPEGSSNYEAYEFSHAVEEIPLLPILHDLRYGWTARQIGNAAARLRVVTYNLLADQYVKGERQQFDYCPPELLHRSYRMPLLMHELLSYHADILCLQEVDWYIFQSYYQPVLESQGYQGFFACKLSGQQEGCAMFWSTKKFERLRESDMHSIGIGEILLDDKQDGWNAHQYLFHQLPHIKGRMQELGQILQYVTLGSKGDPSQRVVVGNTHFYYHPLGDHIRVLQAYGACRKLHQLECKNMLLCGDLNSDPAAGAIQLLQDRSIDGSHGTAWENILVHPTPRKSPEAGALVLPRLTLPLSFPALLPSCTAPYTHCVPGFAATLDYIFSSLTPVEEEMAAPMPNDPQPMPNAEMPSDHLSLVADFKWQ
jgi:mRNA deadenylase 3'-5' endonuclease subunit Ccr4